MHHTGCMGGGLGFRCSGSTKWGCWLLLSHRCWSTRHLQGKGCSADIQLPCAEINIVQSVKACFPITVAIINILAAPRTFKRGCTVLTRESRFLKAPLPTPRNSLSRHVM